MEGMEGMEGNRHERERQMNLRLEMPRVSEFVDQRRVIDGAEWVNACIKRAMKGEPNLFYAIEGGHVLGSPFTADKYVKEVLELAVYLGTGYVVVMAPKKAPDAAH